MGGKTLQIFPFHVLSKWILVQGLGGVRGGGITWIFPSMALHLLLFCFYTALFTGRHQPFFDKNFNKKPL